MNILNLRPFCAFPPGKYRITIKYREGACPVNPESKPITTRPIEITHPLTNPTQK